MASEEQQADKRPNTPGGAGAAPPPLVIEPGVYCRVVWARPDDEVRIVALCDAVYGRHLHWVGRTSLVCSEKPDCPLCLSRYKRLWYGWIMGHCMYTSECVLAQIPLESYRRARCIQDGGLLGRIVVMRRRTTARSLTDVSVQGAARRLEVNQVVDPVRVGEFIELAYLRMAARRGE